MAVTLPCIYKYHAFIYHCEQDPEVSIDILNKLEQRGLHCFLWSRDVVPGNSVVDTILHAIESSHKVILILSPSFLEDGMCRFAVIALVEEIKRRADGDGCLVSVIVEECELPVELTSSRCIDLMKSDEGVSNDGLQRLVEVIGEKR